MKASDIEQANLLLDKLKVIDEHLEIQSKVELHKQQTLTLVPDHGCQIDINYLTEKLREEIQEEKMLQISRMRNSIARELEDLGVEF